MSYVDYAEILTEVQDLSNDSIGLDPDMQACIDGAVARLQALLDSGEDDMLLAMIDRVQQRIAKLDAELGVSDDDE